MTRVSTYAQHQMSMFHIGRTQSNVAETNIQIASGKTAQSYAPMGNKVEQLLSLERETTKTDQYISNIDRTVGRLGIMESSVATMVDRATETLSILASALSGSNIADIPLQQFAQSFSAEIASLLNVQHEGRYLFAGTRTDQPPVDLADPAYTPQATLPATFPVDTGYYQGDQVTMKIRVDDGYELDYGVTADEPAFEQLLRGLSYMEYAGANQDGVVLEQAYNMMKSAVEGLADVRGRIGATGNVLEKAKEGHQNYLTYANNLISGIEDVDIAEATTRLSFDQVQLQGSYLALTRIQSISLLDFLR
ncbi:MAG: flagellin [Inquilinaceae bacterium]